MCSVSPDGRYFCTAGRYDKLPKVWYRRYMLLSRVITIRKTRVRWQTLLNTSASLTRRKIKYAIDLRTSLILVQYLQCNGVLDGLLKIAVSISALTGFDAPDSGVPGQVKNVLLTTARDHIARLWMETGTGLFATCAGTAHSSWIGYEDDNVAFSSDRRRAQPWIFMATLSIVSATVFVLLWWNGWSWHRGECGCRRANFLHSFAFCALGRMDCGGEEGPCSCFLAFEWPFGIFCQGMQWTWRFGSPYALDGPNLSAHVGSSRRHFVAANQSILSWQIQPRCEGDVSLSRGVRWQVPLHLSFLLFGIADLSLSEVRRPKRSMCIWSMRMGLYAAGIFTSTRWLMREWRLPLQCDAMAILRKEEVLCVFRLVNNRSLVALSGALLRTSKSHRRS